MTRLIDELVIASLTDLAEVVVLSAPAVADLADGDAVQYRVQRTGCRRCEPVAHAAGTGDIERCAAGLAREAVLGGERGRHVDRTVACGCQLLGARAAQAAGTLDREPTSVHCPDQRINCWKVPVLTTDRHWAA